MSFSISQAFPELLNLRAWAGFVERVWQSVQLKHKPTYAPVIVDFSTDDSRRSQITSSSQVALQISGFSVRKTEYVNFLLDPGPAPPQATPTPLYRPVLIMNSPSQPNFGGDRLQFLLSTVKKYKALLIVPTLVCVLAAVGYSFLRSTTWTARQSLVIRDDLVGQSYKPGRFDSLDAMKVAQESILDIARKPQVIRNALVELGPPPSIFGSSSNWPSDQLIEDTQGAISVSAPNGSELGTTEIFLLTVKSNTPERVRKFSELLLNEIEAKAEELRKAKFGSIVDELQQKQSVAQSAFDKAASQLNALEKQIGPDLSAMRSLTLEQGGDGVLDRALMEISAEKRAARVKFEQAQQELELLIKSRENPEKMLTTSSELLRMQPRLNDLVAGLSRAQLDLAKQISEFSRSENHPKVKSGRQGILDIQRQIYREIDASIESLNARVASLKKNFDRLQTEEDDTKQRLKSIAALRVDYDKLVREVQKREEVLGQVRGELSQVQSAGGHGDNVTLLTRVDEPQVSTRPDGPSKKTILGAGALGGLMIGMGLMMLVAPPYLSNGFPSGPGGTPPSDSFGRTSPLDPQNRFSINEPQSPGAEFAAPAGFDAPLNPVTAAAPALNPVVVRPVDPGPAVPQAATPFPPEQNLNEIFNDQSAVDTSPLEEAEFEADALSADGLDLDSFDPELLQEEPFTPQAVRPDTTTRIVEQPVESATPPVAPPVAPTAEEQPEPIEPRHDPVEAVIDETVSPVAETASLVDQNTELLGATETDSWSNSLEDRADKGLVAEAHQESVVQPADRTRTEMDTETVVFEAKNESEPDSDRQAAVAEEIEPAKNEFESASVTGNPDELRQQQIERQVQQKLEQLDGPQETPSEKPAAKERVASELGKDSFEFSTTAAIPIDQKEIERQLMRQMQLQKKQKMMADKIENATRSASTSDPTGHGEASAAEAASAITPAADLPGDKKVPDEAKSVSPQARRPIEIAKSVDPNSKEPPKIELARFLTPTDTKFEAARPEEKTADLTKQEDQPSEEDSAQNQGTETSTVRDDSPTLQLNENQSHPPKAKPARESEPTMEIPKDSIDDEFSRFFGEEPESHE